MWNSSSGTAKGIDVMQKSCSPLAIAALGYLAERPMHPYEMYQLAVLRREDRLVKVSPGSLYRAVYALTESGYAAAVSTEREGARPERTTFTITDAGRELLAQCVADLIATPNADYPQFPLALSEAHVLPVGRVVELLRVRREAQQREVDTTEARMQSATDRSVPQMYFFNAFYTQQQLRSEIAWIDDVVEKLESGDFPWGNPLSDTSRECLYAKAEAAALVNADVDLESVASESASSESVSIEH